MYKKKIKNIKRGYHVNFFKCAEKRFFRKLVRKIKRSKNIKIIDNTYRLDNGIEFSIKSEDWTVTEVVEGHFHDSWKYGWRHDWFKKLSEESKNKLKKQAVRERKLEKAKKNKLKKDATSKAMQEERANIRQALEALRVG